MGIDASVVTEWRPSRRAPGMVERDACELLRRLAAHVPGGEAVVELGAFKGRSTGWLLLGASEGQGAHVTSVDPWSLRKDAYSAKSGEYTAPETYQAFKAHMEAVGATPEVHTVKRGYAKSIGAKWDGPPVGLLYHDAEHTADAVEQDLAAWLPHMAEHGVIVLHDACDPRMAVIEGAERALEGVEGWDWDGRELIPWARKPHRRGLLVVRRRRR